MPRFLGEPRRTAASCPSPRGVNGGIRLWEQPAQFHDLMTTVARDTSGDAARGSYRAQPPTMLVVVRGDLV